MNMLKSLACRVRSFFGRPTDDEVARCAKAYFAKNGRWKLHSTTPVGGQYTYAAFNRCLRGRGGDGGLGRDLDDHFPENR